MDQCRTVLQNSVAFFGNRSCTYAQIVIYKGFFGDNLTYAQIAKHTLSLIASKYGRSFRFH